MFIAVCTCSSSRAIRLDIVPDASCSSFICSLKRFISINGVTDLYIKDNAKWFTGLELKDYLSKSSTSCCYILEVSPWWGGFWEWVVQVAKRSLSKFFVEIKTYVWRTTHCYLWDRVSGQFKAVMFMMMILKKSLCLHIYCLVNVFQWSLIVILTKTK